MATKEKTVVSKLVSKICSLLKLGDEGKVANFFARQLKDLSKNLDRAERNLEILNLNKKDVIEEYDDMLEDANAALEEAYLAVDLTKIQTNASCDEFGDYYWALINDCESRIKAIEAQRDEKVSALDKEVQETEVLIVRITKRIAKIS